MIEKKILGKNQASWRLMVAAAKKLGEKYPQLVVTTNDDCIILEVFPSGVNIPRGVRTYIPADGEAVTADSLIQWQDGHWEADWRDYRVGVEAVEEVVGAAREYQEALDRQRQEVLEYMESITS